MPQRKHRGEVTAQIRRKSTPPTTRAKGQQERSKG